MNPPRSLLAILLVGVTVAAGLLVVATPSDTEPPVSGPSAPAPTTPEPSVSAFAIDANAERLSRPPVLPLRVALDLVRPAALDSVASEPPLGSARSARLTGQLVGPRGEPVVGEVRIVAGPNCGQVVATDAVGRFAAVDLLAGLAVVEVHCGGQCTARREVTLSVATETRSHLAMARPAHVAGCVVAADGTPVVDAEVNVDGRRLRTDPSGRFATTTVAAGTPLIEVMAAGYATTRRRLSVAPDQQIAADELRITLQPEARLQLSMAGPDIGTGPVQVWLLPVATGAGQGSPWERFGPLVLGSEPLLVAGLPAGAVNLFVHRAGAEGKAGLRRLELDAAATVAIEVELEAVESLTGRVSFAGQPCAGEVVELIAADPLQRSAAALQLPVTCFSDEVLPLLPAAWTRATSDEQGRFVLSGGDLGSLRELRVVGARHAMRAVRPGERHVELELSPQPSAVGALALAFAPRSSELAIELVVQGRSRERQILPSPAVLRIEELPRGVWRVQVSTGAVDLWVEPSLQLGAERRCEVGLPAALRAEFP